MTARDERLRSLMSAQDVVASGLADRKLRVLWGDYSPKVDLKSGTIFMPRLPEHIDDELFTVTRGYLDHEAAHAMFTDDSQSKGLDKKTFQILNAIEDGRINRMLGEKYLGCKINLEKSRDNCRVEFEKRLGEAGPTGKPLSSLTRAMIALSFLSEGLTRKESLEIVCAGKDAEVQKLLDVITPEIDQMTSCTTTADCRRLAQEVIVKWKKFMTEPPPPPPPPPGPTSPDDDKESSKSRGKGTGGGGRGRSADEDDSEEEKDDSDEDSSTPPPEEDAAEEDADEEDADEEDEGSGDEKEEDASGKDEKEEKEEKEKEPTPSKKDFDESADEEEEDDSEEEEEEDDSEEEEETASEEEESDPEDGGDSCSVSEDEGDEEVTEEEEASGTRSVGEMEDLDDLVVTSETKVGKEQKETSEHLAEIKTVDSGKTIVGEIMPDEVDKTPDGMSDEEFNELMREAADKAERAMIGTILGQRVEMKAGDACKKAAHSSTNYSALIDGDKEVLVSTASNSQTDALLLEALRKVGFVQTKLLLDLQDRGKEWVRDQEKGRLDANRVHRAATGDGRIFRQKVKRNAIDTAMMMVVDFSGSMAGTKVKLACQLAMVFSKACELLDIPNEVVGFTTDYAAYHKIEEALSSSGASPGSRYTRWEPLQHLILKPFEKNFAQTKHAYANALSIGLSNNVDGEAVLWAANRLAKRREKALRLVVLSDGYPCAGGCDARSIRAHLKGAVKRVTASGIECVGIGIQSDAVKDFYPDHVVFSNLDELVAGGYSKLSGFFKKAAGVVRTGG